MYSLKQFLAEKLITVGGTPYPKFGHVVIMAGGGGSGKGFVKDKLLGIEGYTFDVDAIKSLVMKSDLLSKKVKAEFGYDIANFDLGNSDDVGKLHMIVGDILKTDKKKLAVLYTSILTAHPDRKPNLVFDVTMKSLKKMQDITTALRNIGYNPKNIHIVWVINDVEVAIKQNASRKRRVPVEILINTHRGVSNTMKDVLQMGDKISNYLDGDIVFSFNKVNVDTEYVTSGKGGGYMKDAQYFYIKRAGKPVTSLKSLSKDIRMKIHSYVPKEVSWEDGE